MALRHTVLTDLSSNSNLKELNDMLQKIIFAINSGGNIPIEDARPSETSQGIAGITGTHVVQGRVESSTPRLRVVPSKPGSAHKGQNRVQAHNGREWKDVV